MHLKWMLKMRGKGCTWLLEVLVCLCVVGNGFASRAFPVQAVQWVEKHFKQVNPNLEWDASNYLVDLAGRHAKCKNRHKRGFFEVKHLSTSGGTIGGVIDHAKGDEPYADSVAEYIKKKLKHWTTNEPYLNQIVRGERFGCSVKPLCEGHCVIVCLFSHPNYGKPPALEDRNQHDNGRRHDCTYPPLRPPTFRPKPLPPTRPPYEPQPPRISYEPKARAFTKEQYSLAEKITGQAWDRSGLLESLSGIETDCSMVHMTKWNFPFAGMEAKKRGFTITGLFGYHPNKGETQPAMEKIMEKWDRVYVKQIGCSVIADCPGNGKHSMYVVVSCLFSH